MLRVLQCSQSNEMLIQAYKLFLGASSHAVAVSRYKDYGSVEGHPHFAHARLEKAKEGISRLNQRITLVNFKVPLDHLLSESRVHIPCTCKVIPYQIRHPFIHTSGGRLSVFPIANITF